MSNLSLQGIHLSNFGCQYRMEQRRIIIEHLLKRISVTVHQRLCHFALIDMIINRHIKFNILKHKYICMLFLSSNQSILSEEECNVIFGV